MGRSTTGTVVAALVVRWLRRETLDTPNMIEPTINYQVIHSLLRVVKFGLECKRIVDQTIDTCASAMNLRDAIEFWRLKADSEINEDQKRRCVKRGIEALKRYFLLIAFQAYLIQTSVESLDCLETFAVWMERHQELITMLHELDPSNEKALMPVDPLRPGDGVALTSEVVQVVNSRRGGVLAPQTILKFDQYVLFVSFILSLIAKVDSKAKQCFMIFIFDLFKCLFRVFNNSLCIVSEIDSNIRKVLICSIF
jgi:hypothetical protein